MCEVFIVVLRDSGVEAKRQDMTHTQLAARWGACKHMTALDGRVVTYFVQHKDGCEDMFSNVEIPIEGVDYHE